MHAVTSERLEALRRLEIVVLSRYMKGELEKAGIDGRRIHVEPPFVHGLRPDAAADGPPCLLFAGRLTRAKGPLEALEAWRLSDFRDLPLLFAGTGPERERVAARGGTVLGWVDRVRLSALYRRARAMIMPSRWQEPFGLAGLESLTMGTPVVAWRGGAVEEWHVGPGLVDWGDIRGLAEALPLAASSPVAAPTGFDEEDLMRRLVALYETVG
jgi:glycosyltransferase involved in cell wall biosynthesis